MVPPGVKKAIGPALLVFRVERDLTLDQISILTGVSVGNLWKLERGKHVPNDRTAYKILRSLPGLIGEAQKGGYALK